MSLEILCECPLRDTCSSYERVHKLTITVRGGMMNERARVAVISKRIR
jgi:hypothetical protein